MNKNTISSIEIRLLREGQKANKDDVIRIRPAEDFEEGSGRFYITHQDRHSEKKWEFYENWDGVGAYLAQIFTVLPYDADPYYRIQFSLPAYPSIMVRIEDLNEPYLMSRVWDMLDTTARGWPKTVQ